MERIQLIRHGPFILVGFKIESEFGHFMWSTENLSDWTIHKQYFVKGL